MYPKPHPVPLTRPTVDGVETESSIALYCTPAISLTTLPTATRATPSRK